MACYPSLPLLRPPSDPLTVSFGRSHPFPEGPHLPDQRHRLDRGRNGDRTPAFSAPASSPLYDGDGPAGGRRKTTRTTLAEQIPDQPPAERRREGEQGRSSESLAARKCGLLRREDPDRFRPGDQRDRSIPCRFHPNPITNALPPSFSPRRPSPPGRRRPPRAPAGAGALLLEGNLCFVRKHRWRTPTPREIEFSPAT